MELFHGLLQQPMVPQYGLADAFTPHTNMNVIKSNATCKYHIMRENLYNVSLEIFGQTSKVIKNQKEF